MLYLTLVVVLFHIYCPEDERWIDNNILYKELSIYDFSVIFQWNSDYVHSNHLFTYDISCDIYGYIDTQGKDNNDTHEYVMDNIST